MDATTRLNRMSNTQYDNQHPFVMRVGTSKTVWINIIEVCNFYNIPLEVMLERVAKCFQKPCRLDGNKRLIINGLINPKEFNIFMEPTSEEVLAIKLKKAEDDINKQKKLNLLIIERLTSMMDDILELEGRCRAAILSRAS